MTNKHFTHLHLHTEYSLLDGAISLDNLIVQAKKFDFKSIAITDHGNIFGAVKFFQKCKKAGIKPILGIEAYFTEDARIKRADDKYNHLILLVENRIGYRNLCKLISYSYQEGFYFKPRIDTAILEKYKEGLIVTSACLGAQIPQYILAGEKQKALDKIDWFSHTFGPDRFYLEVQPADQHDQKIVNQALFELSTQKNIPLIAAGDCHYVSPDDREAHEIMLAIQTHAKLDDPDRYTFGDCRVPIRSTEEMLSLFPDHQDAIWNTGKVADMCSFDFETGKLFFPQFEIPKEYSQETYFKHLCQIGLDRLIHEGLIGNDHITQYQERLDLETNLIIKMGFVGYFLVVSDFIQWAYRNHIPVGPGRGSAAGSLVAWALQITNIDPIKYNLLFERFLNPERVSMPDIDIDFCIEGREKVIQYVCEKYGHDKVCHIITFGTMMAKGVIKDVARVLGLPFEDSNTLTGYIPDQLKITLKEAIEQEPRLQSLIESNAKIKKIFDISFKLEGLTRHASKHAAGIVISPEPVDEVLPLYVPPKSTELVSQYAMTELETLGFLKMDLLGLKNLTLIDRTLKLIKQRHGLTIDLNKLPLDDTKTFSLIAQGCTSGVFQLESDGLKEVLRKLVPQKFEDIIAVNALYRPGPLGSGMVDDFIERRHGRQKIVYLFDELAPILQETYGVIVYQEQVMKIASAIAGYSLGESDILRRAMGKKKAEVMAEQGKLFVDRAIERGFNAKKAQELFDLMAYFAGYGFNKSHSAAYALIAYQTAYLKAHYPAEFLACLITLEATNTEKMVFYLDEAKSLGLALQAPDINRSSHEFTVIDDNTILFGLHGIKNVGTTAIETILSEREKGGFFTDLFDFCKRVDLRTANKRVIENLICAGTFDCLPGNRAQKYTELSVILEKAVAYKRDIATGQMGLFGGGTLDTKTTDFYPFEARNEWPDKEKLEKEKEVMGFYISAHPLDSYKTIISSCGIKTFEQLFTALHTPGIKLEQEPMVIACGRIKSRRDIVTKKGDRMAFLQLEDTQSCGEIIVFPKVFAKIESWLDTYQVFVVKGVLDLASTTQCKIKAEKFIPLDLIFEEWKDIKNITFYLPLDITAGTLSSFKDQLAPGTSFCQFQFSEQGKKMMIQAKEKISCSQQVFAFCEQNGIKMEYFL